MKKRKFKYFVLKNYKHFICLFFVFISLYLTFFYFEYTYIRLKESLYDVLTSFINYFCKLFDVGYGGVSVNNYTEVPYELPLNLPRSWEEFKDLFSNYWSVFFSKETFNKYIIYLSDILYYISQSILLLSGPFIIIILIVITKEPIKNNSYNKKSKFLYFFNKLENKLFIPCINWIKNFICFFNESKYKKLLLFIWFWNFNFIIIIIEIVAYYFYFVASFDFIHLYVQFLKLLMDLSVIINFVPELLWICFILYLVNKIRIYIGFKRLEHLENMDKGFINERPIISFCYGDMGRGKTKLITDMSLSTEVIFRSKAFEMLLECDLKFPNFPWINLENEIKIAINDNEVFNLVTCKNFIKKLEKKFEDSFNYDKATLKSIIRNRRKKGFKYHNYIFDYDFEKYGLFKDNNLKDEYIWNVILDYAKLYFIYIINTSLIISNYSIRSDNIIDDIGNFPLWNLDFFSRESRYVEVFSKHSHLLDYDMLRLGKKVINSKYSDLFEFGVITISEIGKERKNALELQTIKAIDELANQKNDKFDERLKMIRHNATVMNFPFVKIFVDEQRPESWGANARDLCELIFISNVNKRKLTMPLFEFGEIIHSLFFNNYINKYYNRRYNRSDITLIMYLFHNFISFIHRRYEKIYNLFGYDILKLELESGRMDDSSVKKHDYFLCYKKIYSERYSTDCYAAFFEMKSSRSKYGLLDLPSYNNLYASVDEMKKQNSYFYKDISELFELDKNK